MYGRFSICFLSFTISFSRVVSMFNSAAFSILSNRRPNKRTGNGICGFNLTPLGLTLKYSKLSQQSRIRKVSFLVHQGFSFDFSSRRVPRPIICQNFVYEKTGLAKTRLVISWISIPVSSISTLNAIRGMSFCLNCASNPPLPYTRGSSETITFANSPLYSG